MIAIKIVMIIAATIALLSAANTAWQHYHCETPLGQCDPMQVIPCESVSKIEAEAAALKKLAQENR